MGGPVEATDRYRFLRVAERVATVGTDAEEEAVVRDAVRGYWALASGLTDVTRQRATSAARALVAQGEATAEQVTAIAEDLISTSVTNRAALVGVVRHEIERARTAMGMPSVADVEALTRRIAALESEVARLRGATARTAAAAKSSPTPAKKAAATSSAAPVKKAAAAKSSATPVKKAAAATSSSTPATKAPAAKPTTPSGGQRP